MRKSMNERKSFLSKSKQILAATLAFALVAHQIHGQDLTEYLQQKLQRQKIMRWVMSMAMGLQI